MFFISVSIIIFLVAVQESLYLLEIIDAELTDWQFPNYTQNSEMFGFLKNLVRPIFIIIQAIAIVIFAIQIYPLETILGSKKIVSKLAVASAFSLFLIFIPIVTYTYYTFIAVLFGYVMVLIAFLVNFILTAKIIKQATGDVRKRAIMNIFGFFIFLIGLIWMMRVGWSEDIFKLFNYNLDNYSYDVLFGNLTIIIAMYVMYSGVKE